MPKQTLTLVFEYFPDEGTVRLASGDGPITREALSIMGCYLTGLSVTRTDKLDHLEEKEKNVLRTTSHRPRNPPSNR